MAVNGPFSSPSNATQKSVSASDQAVLLQGGSDFAAPGGVIIRQKGQNAPRFQVAPNGTLTVVYGVDGEQLGSLLGNVLQATGEQIAAVTASGSNQLATLQEANSAQLGKLTDLVSQKADSEAGSPKILAAVAVAALAAFALFAWKK